MSRHRIVRTMDYNDEYDGYDDVYGHSVDDDSCISPSDASQWIFDRARGQQSISAFMANNENIEEEDEDENQENGGVFNKNRRDSENFQMPVLDEIEKAKLMSCIEEIRSVVGDSICDRKIVEASMKYDYDVTKVLDVILNAPITKEKEVSKLPVVKDPLEKDLKPNLSTSNIKFKLPTLKPDGIGSSSTVGENSQKLDEYIKYNFQNSNSNFVASKSIFVVPQLKVVNNSESGSPKLNQLINANKMSSQQSTISFNIPKLSSSLPKDVCVASSQDGSPSAHEILLKKIMDSKKAKNSELNELNVTFAKHLTLKDKRKTADDIIDLTQTLSNSSMLKPAQSINQQQKCHSEKFDIPFIDCDRPIAKKIPQFAPYCQIDMSGILKENLSNLVARPTNFGKILILKYKCRSIPYVSHSYKIKYKLERFKFETTSPDDIVLSHLNKNKI